MVSNIKERPEHFAQMNYDRSSWVVVFHQLPLESAFNQISLNLTDLILTYMMYLDNLQPFYSSLRMLDEICMVAEPEVITPKHSYRVVKFSHKVFIKIEFLNPLTVEEVLITFHGCTSTVKEMTETYNAKRNDYDDETIYNKLLCIFDIPFFPATEEDQIDCSICLTYRCLENRCPIVCCENTKCDSKFHISCLEKYLKMQDYVTVLSICIGECPFCKRKLSNSYAPFFKRITAEKNAQE